MARGGVVVDTLHCKPEGRASMVLLGIYIDIILLAAQ